MSLQTCMIYIILEEEKPYRLGMIWRWVNYPFKLEVQTKNDVHTTKTLSLLLGLVLVC